MDDVTALQRALPRFHEVFCNNASAITGAVCPQSYDYAYELAKIQQKFFERHHGEDNSHHDPCPQALERDNLIYWNFNDFEQLRDIEMEISSFQGTQFEPPLSSKIYNCICMLVYTEGDESAQSSCLASLDLKTLESMRDFVEWYFDERFVENDNHRFCWNVPLWFGLEKIGGQNPEVTLANIRHKLKKACLDVAKARKLGNSAESA